jgi:hypothetical protein
MSCSDTEIDSDMETEIDETETDTDNDTVQIKCKFCDMLLETGFDENNMLHCQKCHNVWDGNAQCNCFY